LKHADVVDAPVGFDEVVVGKVDIVVVDVDGRRAALGSASGGPYVEMQMPS